MNLRLKPAAISYTIKRQRYLLLLSLSFARKRRLPQAHA